MLLSSTSPVAKDVKINDITMHYLERGSGPLLLLLHGFPEHSGIWTPYLDTLGDRFHVVAPDLRGYNLSSKPADVSAYEIEILMHDVLALVQALGHEKAYLVGHDWGGLLSWYLAAHHPAMFQNVTIINAPHPKVYAHLYATDEEQRAKAAYVGFFQTPEAEAALEANNFERLRQSVFADSAHTRSAGEMQGYLDAWGRGLSGGINYYRAYVPRQAALAEALPRITIPTQVIWGEKDSALSIKNLDGLDQHIEHLRIKRYPDATHWITDEKVAELSEDIRTFAQATAATDGEPGARTSIDMKRP